MDLQVFVLANEREAPAEFEQEPFDVLDEAALQVALASEFFSVESGPRRTGLTKTRPKQANPPPVVLLPGLEVCLALPSES